MARMASLVVIIVILLNNTCTPPRIIMTMTLEESADENLGTSIEGGLGTRSLWTIIHKDTQEGLE